MIRYSELIFIGLFMLPLKGRGFDFSKAVVENQLTQLYWLLESGHSTHSLLENGELPLEYAFNNNMTEMIGLLSHFSNSINLEKSSVFFANSDDAESIAYIHYHSWNMAYNDELPSKSLEERISFWKELLASPTENHQVLVLRVNGRVIAFCGYTNNSEGVEINGLYVHPAFQRMGVGKKILGYLSIIFGSGTLFYLWVYENNSKAIQFYEKNGFTKSESKSKKYPNTNKILLKFELRV